MAAIQKATGPQSLAQHVLQTAGGFRHYVLREHDQSDVVGYHEPERGIHWKAEVDTLLSDAESTEPSIFSLRHMAALELLACVRGYNESYPITYRRLCDFLTRDCHSMTASTVTP